MKTIGALLTAGLLAALPLIANAGAPACPDYNGDGAVTVGDILYAVDHYFEDKGDGSVFTVIDVLTAVQHYGESCA